MKWKFSRQRWDRPRGGGEEVVVMRMQFGRVQAGSSRPSEEGE